jgi:6,7-dimethyl-8-ribityllumazine synthase
MIAVVQATFNIEITDLLTQGCVNQLNATQTPYVLLQCPGAVELVGYSKKLIDTKNMLQKAWRYSLHRLLSLLYLAC